MSSTSAPIPAASSQAWRSADGSQPHKAASTAKELSISRSGLGDATAVGVDRRRKAEPKVDLGVEPKAGPMAELRSEADPEQLKALWLVRAQEGMSEETFRDAVKLLPRKGPTPQN